MEAALPEREPPPEQPPLSYLDPDFLGSDDARAVRILSEYLAPLESLRRAGIRDTVVFFGSARPFEGIEQRYYEDARKLARLLTEWARSLPSERGPITVCSGGGGGIMEAANRGAGESGGRSVALNIGLPHEQRPNPYVSPELTFQFHYFFMRKLWFAHLARAVVVFPGGFGTLNELFEILMLSQTRKLDRNIFVLLYGSSYWNEIVNFEALVRHGMISREDLELIHFADDPATALRLLQGNIRSEEQGSSPAFAKSLTPNSQIPAGSAKGRP